MLLIILQNAYREDGEYIDRDEWLSRLWLSHTGKRLKEMLPDNVEVYIENASPRIGNSSDSLFPPDLEHLNKTIERVKPSDILACGKVAQAGLDQLNVDYIVAPHPAWRQLSKEITQRIKDEISCSR